MIMLKSEPQIGRKRVILNFYSIFSKNELPIGQRPIKGNLLFNFVEKWVPNRPKADKTGYYILYLILLNNESPIGRRPIKRDQYFVFNFVEKWAPNRPKADKKDFIFCI